MSELEFTLLFCNKCRTHGQHQKLETETPKYETFQCLECDSIVLIRNEEFTIN